MLKQNEWKQLKKVSDKLGILFFATVGFKEEVDFLKNIGCDSIKIASSDVNYHGLIEYAAEQGLCIQLDTGNSTLGEIEEAVDIIRSKNNNNIIIHHCPSGYPARSDKINLRIIKTLKNMFPFPIGFSDHSPGWDMDIAAISLGANLVEKTITENKYTRSVEHAFSLETNEFKPFIDKIREIEMAMGNPRRILDVKEIEKRKNVRRSAYLVNNEKKNTPLSKIKFEFKRPGHGVSPPELKSFSNRKLNKNLKSGDLLNHDDIK
jgi:sialic acid synthase SpsE